MWTIWAAWIDRRELKGLIRSSGAMSLFCLFFVFSLYYKNGLIKKIEKYLGTYMYTNKSLETCT